MPVPRVYLPTPLHLGETTPLDERARHHIINVLRQKTGSQIIVFNGEGGEYTTTLLNIGKKAEILIGEFNAITRESPLQTHLYQGISRGERMEYTIQKAAELGVSEITPVFTARTIVKIPDNKIEKRLEHWLGIAISACEQSGRTRIPLINTPITFSPFFKQYQTDKTQCNLVFDMEAEIDLKTALEITDSHHFNFLIGPEGGLEHQEITTALTAGFTNTRLGSRIFRTETAGPVVLALLQYTNGDLGKL